MPGLV